MEQERDPILEPRSMQEIEIPIASNKVDFVPMTVESSCNAVCPFSGHENGVVASEESAKSARKLSGLIVFYAIVMVVEIIGGLKAHSLAVICDAAHLLSDIGGFSISLFAVWASSWTATPHQSFGYNRLEVLGALLSVQLIWLISGFLIYEAIGRLLLRNALVNGKLMFAIAAFGFVLNAIMVAWLGHDHSHHHHHHYHHGCQESGHDHHGCQESGHDHHECHTGHDHHECHTDHDHGKEELSTITDEESNALVSSSQKNTSVLNINLQGAYLHVMTDMIQSFGVMIAGAIIWAKPEWFIVDLICTLMFSVLSLSTTLPLLRNIYGILMERTPSEINISKLENGIRSIKGVQDVHDLHVWAITLGKIVLSCHVVAEPGISCSDLLGTIKYYCEKSHHIEHVTIQIE